MAYTPGGRVTIKSPAFVLAEANGGEVPDVSGTHPIERVGRYELLGRRGVVWRAYFGEGRRFVERATDERGATQLRVFAQAQEVAPSSEEEWDFFLGRTDEDDPSRNVVAFIGRPAVDFGEKGTHYDRLWGASDAQADAVEFVEHLHSPAIRSLEMVDHAAMLYVRVLRDEPRLQEYLLVEKAGEVIKVWVGIDVTEASVDAI